MVNKGDDNDSDFCVKVPATAEWTSVEVVEGATLIVAVLSLILNNTVAVLLTPQPLSPKKSMNCDAADDRKELVLAVAALKIVNAGVTPVEELDNT